MEAEGRRPPVEELSSREMEVLALLIEGLTNREIADRLILSLNTVKWYARQIYGKLGVGNRKAAVARAIDLELFDTRPDTLTIPHNLPGQMTSFVGREAEIQQLHALLSDDTCRLVTLIGPGGIGKTRLALQSAEQFAADTTTRYDDGVFFVPLAEVERGTSIVFALSRALRFGFQPLLEDAETQLLHHLRGRRLLLLLDNLEHLLDDAALTCIRRLLAASPQTQLLATSRTATGLPGEHLLIVDRLAFPDAAEIEHEADPVAAVQTYPAIQLFQHCATRVRPTWALNRNNLDAVIRVCRAVDGVPLGVELATGWLSTLRVEEVVEEVEQDLGILSEEAAGVADRHRSLRNVFDTSWQMLSATEQATLLRLTVFRGGFQSAAARAVADATPRTLRALIRKSWIQRTADGRLVIHELLRQFAAHRLARSAKRHAALQHRHSYYFRRWMGDQVDQIKSPAHEAALAAIDRELENVKAACGYAVQARDFADLPAALHGCGLFFRWVCRYREGAEFFDALCQQFRRTYAETTPDLNDLRARQAALLVETSLQIWTGTLVGFLSDWRRAEEAFRAAIAILEAAELATIDTRDEQARIALQLGYGRLYARPEIAYQNFQTSSELFEGVGDSWSLGLARLALGRAARARRNLIEARQATEASVRLCKAAGNNKGYCHALTTLGSIGLYELRFQSAITAIRNSMAALPASDADGRSVAYHYLGKVHFWSGEFSAAVEAFASCVQIRAQLGMPFYEIGARLELASIALHQGDADRAVDQAQHADLLALDYGYRQYRARSMLLLAHRALSERTELKALAIYKDVGDQLGSRVDDNAWLECQAGMGIALLALKDIDVAWEHLMQALTFSVANYDLPAVLLALVGMAQAFELRGDHRRAQEIQTLVAYQPLAARSKWFARLTRNQITVPKGPPMEGREFWSTIAAYTTTLSATAP